jgi:hypothetical protein
MTLLYAIVGLAAELPDPGQWRFPGFCGTLGGFVSGVRAARRKGRDHIGRGIAEGSLVGFGAGFLVWMCALARNLL